MLEANLHTERIRLCTIISFKCYIILSLLKFDLTITCSFIQAHEKLSKRLDNIGQDLTKKLKLKLKLQNGLHGRAVPVGDDGLKGDSGNLVLEASKRYVEWRL